MNSCDGSHKWDRCICTICGEKRYQDKAGDDFHYFSLSDYEDGGDPAYSFYIEKEWTCSRCGMVKGWNGGYIEIKKATP